jgi:hypothetical protein
MLYLFNTNIVPDECVARITKISQQTAKSIVSGHKNEFISAIGHEVTANIMSTLLNVDVTVNRIHALPNPLDKAISLKINGRIMEGSILSMEEIEKVGYTLYLIEFYPANALITLV